MTPLVNHTRFAAAMTLVVLAAVIAFAYPAPMGDVWAVRGLSILLVLAAGFAFPMGWAMDRLADRT